MFKRGIHLLVRAKQLFLTDSLFRNATLLMASTAIMSVLGFGFWLFIAHLYSAAMIGEASALIAMTTLISNVSLLGLNAGLIRFLPHSKNQSREINAAIIVVGTITLIAATAYLFISAAFGVHVALLASTWHKIAFVLLMSTVSINSLTDAVFIGNRRAEYHTAGYAMLGIVKLVLPMFFIPFGALGIFMAYILAMVASLILSFYLMRRTCDYRLFARPDWGFIRKARKYATNNYIGVILAGLPAQLMPMFIIKRLGTADVAYFSMAWTMVNLLYVIPSAASQSLLAESSHDITQKSRHLKHTVRLLAAILVPIVTLSVIVAPYLLKIFGGQYASNGTAIFQLLALSTFTVAVSTVCTSVLNIEHRSFGTVIAQAGALLTTFASVTFLIRYGLPGVGGAMLLGSIASNVCLYLVFKFRKPRLQKPEEDEPIAPETNPGDFVISHANLRPFLAEYGITSFAYKVLDNGSKNHTILVKHDQFLHVLRIYSGTQKADDEIEQEVDFMEFLIKRGIPVPKVVKNLQHKPVSHTDLDGKTWQHMLMEFGTGQHPKKYTYPILYRMAKSQAYIHLHGQTYAEQKANSHPGATQRHWWNSLLHVAPQGFSHFDFDASNILVTDDKITSILDFEGMRHDPLVKCIFFTLTRIYDLQPSVADLRLYLTAYQQVRKLNVTERLILSCALTLHYRSPKLLAVYATR